MQHNQRLIVVNEYHSVCEVCGARIVISAIGPDSPELRQEIGTIVALCPRCADSADVLTPYMYEHELREAFDGTQHP